MSSEVAVLHWDDARTWRGERGHIAGKWRSLTGRASQVVGVKRIEIDAGMWSTPLHLEGAEEEHGPVPPETITFDPTARRSRTFPTPTVGAKMNDAAAASTWRSWRRPGSWTALRSRVRR